MLNNVKNRIIMMKKGRNAKQEQYLDSLKTTCPNLKLVSYEDLARLREPELFPYKNKTRLYNRVKDSILQTFFEFAYTFDHLPSSDKREIMTNSNFVGLMNNITRFSKDVEKLQKSDEPEKYFAFVMYQNFFTMGLEGLISTMPNEFRPYLETQIKPIMLLMQSIAKHSKRLNPKSKVPLLIYPQVLS